MTGAERNNIKEENRKRLEAMYAPYDPVSGVGSPLERVDVNFTYNGFDYSFKAPLTMYDENKFVLDALNETGTLEKCMEIVDPEGTTDPSDFFEALIENRFKHDFEFWAYQNAKIQEKKTKSIIRFLLNRPQRKTLMSLEKQRLAGIPIRTIILKARQWGGSTLTQIYMAWLQLLHYENWHSLIVTDVENQARTIRGMYTRLLNRYPKRLGEYSLTPFEGSTKNRIIKERGCVISIGSAQKPESLRSNDVSMAHLSEVAFWQTTPQKSAEDLLQTIRPSIPSAPGTLIVMESTAKGVGSLFHNEWLSAKAGESGYDPVFVAWHEIEMYQKDIEPEELDKFIDTVFNDPYLAFLWKEGATLEGINWYRWYKASENWSDWRMQSEYPSTDLEAFASTNQRVFAPEYVKNLRKTCRKPELTGEIRSDAQKGKEAFNNISFVRDSKGNLLVWALPDTSTNGSNRYVVSVDIGGRTPKADYSIIKVIDRYWMEEGGYPETVATWRGHLDQDLIAWKAAIIAKYYNDALLVVESNSLDKDTTDGDHFLTVLDEIVPFYENVYARNDPEKIRQGLPLKYGWMTTQANKSMAINTLNACAREESFVERDSRVCDEMDTYEIKPNGSLGAVEGCHDDLVMATAIGLWICVSYLDPFTTKTTRQARRKIIVSEATI